MKRNSIVEVTTLTPYPFPVAKSGTVDSTAGLTTIKGTGTDFQNDVRVGDWLWSATLGEMREVVGISYDRQVLNVDTAFSAPLVAEALSVIPESEFEEISISNTGGVDTTVDGEAFPAGLSVTFDKAERSPGSTVDPVLLDGATSTLTLSFQK